MIKDLTVGALVFYVKDIKRTEKFYTETLGLKVNTAEGHHGPFLITQAGPTLLIFFQKPEKPGNTPIVVFTINGGIDDVMEELAKKGVQIVLPVSTAPDGGLSSDFLDPDGHVLSFYQPQGAPRRSK